MQFSIAIVASMAIARGVKADFCASGSVEIGGNWYCQPVNAIKYAPVGTPGSYNQITNMAPDGTCSSTPKSFSGPMAPLDEEVSLHFRGPIHLEQLAVYTLSASTKLNKREESPAHARRHGQGHQHLHKHDAEPEGVGNPEKRDAVPYGTINGVHTSSSHNYTGPSSASGMVAGLTGGTAASSGHSSAFGFNSSTSTAKRSASVSKASASKTASTSASASSAVDSAGSYTRVGYYNSAAQVLDGMVFLGNHGGQGSGVWDYTYGASLSYLSSDGCSGAPSSQILADIVLASDKEFTVLTDTPCTDGSCGYVRPGSVAYHGFGGADKIFLVELSMPTDNSGAANIDMPAFWILNAQIPRTIQYGKASCSCWASGCGEFDILEVLSTGSDKCKSTFHMNVSGGDSDYFTRPTGSNIKVAVVFRSSDATAHILLLDDSVDFSTSITAAQIQQWCESAILDKSLSDFTLA